MLPELVLQILVLGLLGFVVFVFGSLGTQMITDEQSSGSDRAYGLVIVTAVVIVGSRFAAHSGLFG